MGYRDITVDGVDYKYTIGRTHVKVRGLGVWPLEDVGTWCVKSCKCGCAMPLRELYPDLGVGTRHEGDRRLFESVRVYPSEVAERIRKETSRLVSG